MTTKITLNNIADTALATLTGPKVTTIVYPGTETATDITGGATINLTGAGFQSGCSVLVASTASSVVTFISSTQISFIAPALSAGTYVIYVINPDGGTAISIPGISYSGTPNWTTTAGSLGSAYETGSISATLTATGDNPVTYTVASGTLPTGSSLASDGTLSGTAVATASATTYTFTVTAKDAQNQTTNRSFSLTINPDVVTWSSPADNTTYTVAKDTAISNVTMSATSAAGGSITYTADTLPTGLSITGANIAGTPTVTANTTTVLTATSTTTRTATKTINWVVNVGNDPFFKYTTLLLQGAGTTFVDDASTNNFAVTTAGDTKPNSFNPYTPGYYSAYFDSSSAISLPTTQTTTGSFTAECWFYRSADPVNYHVIFGGSDIGSGGTVNTQLTVRPTGAVGFVINAANGAAESATGVVPLGRWSHIVWVRSGTSCATFVNGSRVATGTSSGTLEIKMIGSGGNGAGAIFAPSYSSVGYISNARITTIAVYDPAQTTLTVPTSPLTAITGTTVLTCQSNRLIDNSSNAYVLTALGAPQIKSFQPFTPNSSYSTYGSGYFDGTGDSIQVPSGACISGTGDFTAECWIYPTTVPGTYNIIACSDANSGLTMFGLNANGTIFMGRSLVDVQATSSNSVRYNTWNHLAISRSSGSIRIFVNGSQGYLGSITTSYTSGTVRIGTDGGGSALPYTGYISDFRIIPNSAIYTSNFTPPTAPLTAIANTSLLTLQNNQSVNNSTFLDNSSNNFLVTRNGNSTQGTFSPYGDNWSNYFDGNGDYLSVSTSTAFGYGTGDFTIEFWTLWGGTLNSLNGGTFIEHRSAVLAEATVIYLSTAGVINFYDGPANVEVSTGVTITRQWTHIALTRASGVWRMFVNGSLAASRTSSSDLGSTKPCLIGQGQNGTTTSYNGYISNVRIVKGTAVYTSAFTPPTTPLTPVTGTSLLTCQSNRLIDNSMNNFTITKNGDTSVQRFSPFNPASVTPASYSAYFDGSGDYMNVPQSTGFALGTGDFTIECWVYYIPGGSGDRFIVDNGNGNFLLRYAAGATLQFYAQSNLRLTYAVTLANAWYHLAVVHSGTTYTLYVNGVAVNTSTGSDNITNSSAIGIGAISGGNGDYFSGHISNVRIVKGVAVYTGAFTVPTIPLTATQSSGTNIAAITGTATSVLTCQSSTFIDNSTNNFAITGGGDSRPVTQNPFGYTSTTTNGYTVSTIGGSAYFDGSGDYITVPNDTNINLGSSNFTIEMWVYLTSSAGNFTLFQKPSSYELKTDSSRWVWQINANNNIFVANGTLANNTWTHVAMVRNGATSTLYLNGAAYASGTSADATTNTNALIVGSGSAAFGGYTSDFRIIKGTAVYKSNFLPPAAPLTAVQNTTFLANMTNAGIYDASMMNNMETVGDAKLRTAVSKFGGSSMSFDGTGDRLVSASSIVNTLSNGDFTIEFWLYPSNTSSAYRALVSSENYPATTGGWSLYQNGAAIEFWMNGSASATINATSAITASTWQHLALCRASGTLRLFINGTSVSSVSHSTSLTGQQIWIGDNNSSGGGLYFYNGYMDDLRITNGYARYTSNFTAPTSEFKTF